MTTVLMRLGHREREHQTCACLERQPREYTARKWPSANQGDRPQKKSNLPKYAYERTFKFFLSVETVLQSRKLCQEMLNNFFRINSSGWGSRAELRFTDSSSIAFCKCVLFPRRIPKDWNENICLL